MNKKVLELAAAQFENELTQFRLTGNLEYLYDFIELVTRMNEELGNSLSLNEFFNALTDNEKFALNAIKEEIGLAGNISVVKMLQKTNLSRPVFTSLFQKMEKYNVAKVKNQGVKGTYIEMIGELAS